MLEAVYQRGTSSMPLLHGTFAQRGGPFFADVIAFFSRTFECHLFVQDIRSISQI